MKRKSPFTATLIAGMLIATAAGCSDQGIVSPDDTAELAAAQVPAQVSLVVQAGDQACWGQATRVFAALGVMGEHASSYETPRLGLRNLARSLYEAGLLADDSMQALGAFVAAAEELSIDACM